MGLPETVRSPAVARDEQAPEWQPPALGEFTSLLTSDQNTSELVTTFLFQGIPFVFLRHPDSWDQLRSSLASALDCADDDVLVVGSAKLGYSLAPHKYGQPFTDESDIDVVIISRRLYEAVWLSVLRWHYTRRYRLPPADRKWDKARRNDFYWGYLNPVGFQYRGLSSPRELRKAKKISTQWFNAFQQLGRFPAFAERKVSGRLYCSRDHALSYHAHGFRELRRMLTKTESGWESHGLQ